MIEVTDKPLSPERVIAGIKNDNCGCVVTYVGLIRNSSHDKPVLSVEYVDSTGNAAKTLERIVDEARHKWSLEDMAICHRTGKLKVGDINLVVAVASAHRTEGLAACRYAIDQFKERLPTQKTETYQDGSLNSREAH